LTGSADDWIGPRNAPASKLGGGHLDRAVDQALHGELRRIDARLRNPAVADLVRADQVHGSVWVNRRRPDVNTYGSDEQSELDGMDPATAKTLTADHLLDRPSMIQKPQRNLLRRSIPADHARTRPANIGNSDPKPLLARNDIHATSGVSFAGSEGDQTYMRSPSKSAAASKEVYFAATNRESRSETLPEKRSARQGQIDMAGLD
jgi:hypothetical protein